MSSPSAFGNVAIVPSLALFRGLTAAGLPPVVFLQGTVTPNDGGQGYYQVNLTDKTTPDNGTSVIVDGAGYRWELVTTDTSTQIIASLTNNGTRPALVPIMGGIVTIASAATVDLATATQTEVTVTGSAGPITSLGTVQAGVEYTLRFTGAPTLAYNATSLILPGSANIAVAPGDSYRFLSLGSGNWQCVGFTQSNGQPISYAAPLAAAVTRGTLGTFTEYAASATWTKPAGLVAAYVEVVGGGGGGGGGARVILTGSPSGGGGGGGGSKATAWFDAADLASSEVVTVGAAGASGAGATSDGNGGSNGGAGGASSFGSKLQAFGGGFGSGGAVAANTGGGAGASLFEAGANASGATGGAGQHGGANGGSATFGGNGGVSAGGGGCGSGGAGGFAGGYVTSSLGGGSGGGAGAGLAAAGTEFAGGDGGPVIGTISPPAGGAAKSPGTSPAAVGYGGGAGGGGGGSNNAGVGGAGGTGATPGGGGGGGGCAIGGNGGAGGAGGAGIVRVWCFF